MKKLTVHLVAAGAVLAATLALHATGALAGGKEDPPPPSGEECSPGYWKNHTSVWFGVCCDDKSKACDSLLSDLQARGPGSDALRSNASGFLNDCFAKELPCAETDDGKTPPVDVGICSPGYWKNHTDVWFGVCCDGKSGSCDKLLSDLQTRGPGSDVIRANASLFLNDCFAKDPPCVEEDDDGDPKK